jgi:hypothetical protein
VKAMTETSRALLLFCNTCKYPRPQKSVPAIEVRTAEANEARAILKNAILYFDGNMDFHNDYDRQTFARGRTCTKCGNTVLTIELPAERLADLVESKSEFESKSKSKSNKNIETLKEITRLHRQISGLIKKLKQK